MLLKGQMSSASSQEQPLLHLVVDEAMSLSAVVKDNHNNQKEDQQYNHKNKNDNEQNSRFQKHQERTEKCMFQHDLPDALVAILLIE